MGGSRFSRFALGFDIMAVDPQILKHGVDVDIDAISIGTASGWRDANPMVVETFKLQFLNNYKKKHLENSGIAGHCGM